MTPQLAKWLTEMASNIAAEDEPAGRPIETALEQRIAVGLLQARAAECRALAGELQISGATRNQVVRMMWAKLLDRSSALEKLGLELCETWPPLCEEQPKPKLVELVRNWVVR